MLQIYSNVDDPDGFYGIKTNDVRQNLLRRLDHEGHHLRAFGLHGAELEAGAGAATNRADLIASARHLHSFGLNHTARTIARTVQNEAGRKGRDSDDLFFDIAWRTGDWDLPVPESTRLSSSGAFYSALRAVHRERDAATAKAKIEDAIQVEMLRLKDLGLERMSELNSSIDHLICLGDALRWYDVTVQRALSEVDMANAALQTFVQVPTDTRYVHSPIALLAADVLRYSLADRQHATRTSILSAAQARENQNFLGDLTSPLSEGLANLEISTRLRFCRFAREEGNGQAAINAITAIQHLEGTAASAATSDEFCAVLWMQGEHALALQQVNEMIGTLQVSAGVKRDESQRRLGVLLGRQVKLPLRCGRGQREVQADQIRLIGLTFLGSSPVKMWWTSTRVLSVSCPSTKRLTRKSLSSTTTLRASPRTSNRICGRTESSILCANTARENRSLSIPTLRLPKTSDDRVAVSTKADMRGSSHWRGRIKRSSGTKRLSTISPSTLSNPLRRHSPDQTSLTMRSRECAPYGWRKRTPRRPQPIQRGSAQMVSLPALRPTLA